ncbi:MAG TPA: AAA family ATPase, partial [Chloroflexota bacterium]|nr:AAA family ATPase [Chloroflexota bacterium]
MSAEKRRARTDERGPGGREEFARRVREALNRLYDVAYLQNHPLARLLPPASADRAAVGKALQRALQDAIETLHATEQPAAGAARSGRSYDLLRLRFVEGLAVDEVCERLGISSREYYREYPKGLEAVASVLWERWQLGQERELSPEPPAKPVAAPPPARRPFPAQPLSSFVGREHELARIREMIGAARLMTLLGPPGTGKTRLALAAAALLVDSFPDGVVFVSLGAVREDAAVIPAIVHALGLEAVPGLSLEDRLIEGLRDRHLLLILDNFEQIVGAGPSLVALLAACPGIRALVTSRTRLNLRGEHVLPVPPLAVPDAATPADFETVRRYDAVRLFGERAQEVDPEFTL